jgi:putative peptide zinc metalloprotease protein
VNFTDPHVREPSTAVVALRDGLVFTPDVSRDPPGYTIEDPLRGKFYRVGVPEYTVLSLLDGRVSIAEAVGVAAVKLGAQALAEHEALALVRWLLDCQLAYPAAANQTERLSEAARRNEQRRLLSMLNPLAIQIPLCRPDRLLGVLTQRLEWLFSGWSVAVWIAVVGYAIYLIAAGWDCLGEQTPVILDRDNWLRLAAAWLLLKVLHELAHGVVCKHYGGNVPTAGLTLILLFPLAYVDVTSSWRFRSKWQRIATAAAGMAAELFVAALAIIAWSNTPQGLAHHMALNIAVTAGVSTLLFNGNPLVRFDGYFIASDLLDVPNLYSCGQQYLDNLVQEHLLSRQTPSPSWPAGRKGLIRLYALAALAWRALFYLTLALSLVGRLSHLGVAIAVGLLGFGWGMPLAQMIRRTVQAASGQCINRGRIAATAAAGMAVALTGALLATRPGRVDAPAVVDYASHTVIRAASPGFVREVCVANGQQVRTGQVIVVLQNTELETELADLELALQQSIIRGRIDLQNDELAKQQVEEAQQRALSKKIADLRSRVESLTIRAPSAGRLVARDLDSLPGRYLHEGNEIAVLGQEDAKELVIAVVQDDVHIFDARQRDAGDVQVRTRSGNEFSARLSKVDPRASTDLPHPALAANVGGPLAVKPRSQPEKTGETAGTSYEMLAPVFIGKAILSNDQSLEVWSGQVTTVSLHTASDSAGARWHKSLQRWIEKYTSAHPVQ